MTCHFERIVDQMSLKAYVCDHKGSVLSRLLYLLN